MICKCNIDNHCQHPKHTKYSLPIILSDCDNCPLKIVGLPSSLKQVSNFLTDTVAVAMTGFEEVSPAAKTARLDICNGCPLHADGRCIACGCSSRVKSAFAAEQCPLKYWEHIKSDLSDEDVVPVPVFSPATLTSSSLYAPAQMVEDRNKTCDSCEYRRGRKCSGCSCNIYMLSRLTSSRCPKDKWNE